MLSSCDKFRDLLSIFLALTQICPQGKQLNFKVLNRVIEVLIIPGIPVHENNTIASICPCLMHSLTYAGKGTPGDHQSTGTTYLVIEKS